MSMTQLALVKRTDLPTKSELINAIGQLEHKIEILDDFDNFDNLNGISCKFKGTKTFFKLYFSTKEEILRDYPNMYQHFDGYDYAVSFIWGADFAAGASIGIMCISLIDLCNSKVFYMDDDIHYTRKMLLEDTPLFIQELEKQKSMNRPSKTNNKNTELKETNNSSTKRDNKPNQSFWNKLKRLWS